MYQGPVTSVTIMDLCFCNSKCNGGMFAGSLETSDNILLPQRASDRNNCIEISLFYNFKQLTPEFVNDFKMTELI